MIRKIYRWRLLAPVLFGTLLAGGCQLTGTDTLLIPPPNATLGKQVQTSPASIAGATFSPNTTPDQQPNATLVDRDQRPALQPGETEGQVAANVTHITDPVGQGPGSDATALPPAPPQIPTGQAGVVQRTDPQPATPADAEMTMKFNGSGSEIKALQAHMQALEQRLEQHDQVIRETGDKVQAATELLNQARARLQKIQEETHDRMQTRNKEESEYLKSQIKKLAAQLGEEAFPAQPTVNDRK